MTSDCSGVAVLMVAPGVVSAEKRFVNTVVDLARRQDLVIVCGTGDLENVHSASSALTTQLREMLPRRIVVALLVSDHPDAVRHEFDTIASLVDNSAVTVAIVRAADLILVAAQLARHLRTRVLLRLDLTGYRPVPIDPLPGRSRSATPRSPGPG